MKKAKAKREAPKVEATTPNLPVWAWKVKGGTELWHIGFGPAPSSGVESVEYVKADPLADAVVAAALARSTASREVEFHQGDANGKLYWRAMDAWNAANKAFHEALEALEQRK